MLQMTSGVNVRSVQWIMMWVSSCGLGAWIVPALGQTTSWVPSECPGAALEFKADIRMPDEWEDRWEQAWPDISESMQAWRANNFASLQGLWRFASPCIADWTERATALGLPPSAGWLPLWMSLPESTTSPCECGVPEVFWSELSQRKDDPVGALEWLQGTSAGSYSGTSAGTYSGTSAGTSEDSYSRTSAGTSAGSSKSEDSWGASVRTGIRLMENLNMPMVHLTRPGDTVYKLGRQYKVSPTCISQANGVWNELRPGIPLLIPFAE
ncbi:MAG: LysM peptidoglycan-binding domain-containing protein [Bacteroidetes bacterium]|nr:LysM peptidoglycan-binding domain-containing protein [Bacteroidota bacterium]